MIATHNSTSRTLMTQDTSFSSTKSDNWDPYKASDATRRADASSAAASGPGSGLRPEGASFACTGSGSTTFTQAASGPEESEFAEAGKKKDTTAGQSSQSSAKPDSTFQWVGTKREETATLVTQRFLNQNESVGESPTGDISYDLINLETGQ
ncbi:hypothetical protein I302_103382 [Kwoniella bestiolae CBS 10118]|uniref:Uncharacterized protein n=1 Tax=Kwoniella bestiolae CBS 10118 TaxID=1296100 RepID=A0A1B9G8B0_9TREE|nr:hypothetical protein I302_02083 [Kwoniella bestiolae CBS 10118]OCF27243.1 hypothetical protein I302_02083 [Kwoniella bestiolae CBS 10118]